jgi:hypothetical protein
VNQADRAWVDSKLTAQPIGPSLEHIRLTGARERVPKKSYIRATGFRSETLDHYYAIAKARPGWTTYEIPCGHDIMIDEPSRLAEFMLAVL